MCTSTQELTIYAHQKKVDSVHKRYKRLYENKKNCNMLHKGLLKLLVVTNVKHISFQRHVKAKSHHTRNDQNVSTH